MREERLCLARHPDNGPAVLCPACLQRLLADRSLNSVRNGDDAIIVDASGHEIIADRTGSPLNAPDSAGRLPADPHGPRLGRAVAHSLRATWRPCRGHGAPRPNPSLQWPESGASDATG